MKKFDVILIFFCFGYFFLSLSCENRKTAVENPVTFDSIQIHGVYHLFNDPKKPNCNLTVNFKYPVSFDDNSNLEQLQAIFVKAYFGDNYDGKSPQDAIIFYKEDYLKNYKNLEACYKEELEFRGMTEEDDTAFLSYYETSFNTVTFNKNGILTFIVDYSDYTGGAHGSHIYSTFVIDLDRVKLLKENDIFYEESLDKITQVILQNIMNENEIQDSKDLEYLGYDTEAIFPNGNFTVDEKGLTYYFNQYEIAPYEMGTIKVFLPYEEISIYMKKDSPLAALAKL